MIPPPEDSRSIDIHDMAERHRFAEDYAAANTGVSPHDVLEVFIQAAAGIYPSCARNELWTAVTGLLREEETD